MERDLRVATSRRGRLMSPQTFILFAEDDPTQAALLELACKRAGIPKSGYAICANGLQAISFLERLDPHNNRSPWPSRIVTDFRMPLLDGIGFLSWLKQNPFFKDVPVTVMSAFLTEEEEARAKLMGADEILKKCVRFQELFADVSRWYSDTAGNWKRQQPLALA